MTALDALRSAAAVVLARTEADLLAAQAAESEAIAQAGKAHVSPGDGYWETRAKAAERHRVALRVAEALL